MNYIIETNDLVKRYGRHTVIKKVNMHVPEGSVYGFVGENGSGKTTIMRLLMGLANPTKGTFSLFGVQSKDKKIYKVKNQISAIVESPSLVPSMNAYDNLKFACMYYGVKDFSIIDNILNEVGLNNVGNKHVKDFSLGMRQRLGIGILLLNNPKLLLLDEPLNGLDPSGIAEIRDLILSLSKKGITILISSHILSELEKVATYYGFIRNGTLLKEISAAELSKECSKCIELRHDDMKLLEKALNSIKLKNFEVTTNCAYVYDEITPLELLSKLYKTGVEVTNIKTLDESVENYYLKLLGGNEDEK